MTLPLSPFLSLVSLFAILFAVRLTATRLPASIASYALLGVVLALFYVGPLLYGKDWKDFGFLLGVCIGGFGYKAYLRKTEDDDGEQKQADLRSRQIQMFLVLITVVLIAFVVMLVTGR